MAVPEAVVVGSESRVAAGAATATKGLGGAMGVGAMAAAVLGAAELGEGSMGVEETVEVERAAAATAAGATAAAVLAAVRAARAAVKVAASEGRWAFALRQTARPHRG